MNKLLLSAAAAIALATTQIACADDNIDAKLQEQMQQIEARQQQSEKTGKNADIIYQRMQGCIKNYEQKYGLTDRDISLRRSSILVADIKPSVGYIKAGIVSCSGNSGDAVKQEKAGLICSACAEKYDPCHEWLNNSQAWLNCMVNSDLNDSPAK